MKPRSKKALVITAVIILILLFIVVQIDDFIYYFDASLPPNQTNYEDSMLSLEFALFRDNVIHVRFVEMKRHISSKRRAEYVFEIIEWVNHKEGVDDDVRIISLYSPAFPGKFKSLIEIIGYEYIPGTEYVIFTDMHQLYSTYAPLNDINKSSTYLLDQYNYYEITNDMTPDQYVNRLQEIMEEVRIFFQEHGLESPDTMFKPLRPIL